MCGEIANVKLLSSTREVLLGPLLVREGIIRGLRYLKLQLSVRHWCQTVVRMP
jgi:hypothetical protein